jgi:hypothetical protein
LLFPSGKDDSSSNGNSGADGSKTLLFGSGKSYNETVCVIMTSVINKCPAMASATQHLQLAI